MRKIVMEKITHFHVNPGPLSRWQLKERIVSNIFNFLECQMFFQELESVCLLEKKNLGWRIIKGSSSQMLKALTEPASAPESRSQDRSSWIFLLVFDENLVKNWGLRLTHHQRILQPNAQFWSNLPQPQNHTAKRALLESFDGFLSKFRQSPTFKLFLYSA